jgi:hypothetical protein
MHAAQCQAVCTSHLGDAALHDEEVWVVHVELHRLEQVGNTPARSGRSSTDTDTTICVSMLYTAVGKGPDQGI